jgi:hypothetical protein
MNVWSDDAGCSMSCVVQHSSRLHASAKSSPVGELNEVRLL